jgi:hypothetical protein
MTFTMTQTATRLFKNRCNQTCSLFILYLFFVGDKFVIYAVNHPLSCIWKLFELIQHIIQYFMKLIIENKDNKPK